MKILQIKQSAANWQRLCLPLLMLLFACGMLGYTKQASAQTSFYGFCQDPQGNYGYVNTNSGACYVYTGEEGFLWGLLPFNPACSMSTNISGCVCKSLSERRNIFGQCVNTYGDFGFNNGNNLALHYPSTHPETGNNWASYPANQIGTDGISEIYRSNGWTQSSYNGGPITSPIAPAKQYVVSSVFIDIKACGGGFYDDSVPNRCRCPEGTTYNTTTKMCEPDSAPSDVCSLIGKTCSNAYDYNKRPAPQVSGIYLVQARGKAPSCIANPAPRASSFTPGGTCVGGYVGSTGTYQNSLGKYNSAGQCVLDGILYGTKPSGAGQTFLFATSYQDSAKTVGQNLSNGVFGYWDFSGCSVNPSCPSGATGVPPNCQCQSGSYYDSSKNTCDTCPGGQIRVGNSCECPGLTGWNGNSCISCPSGATGVPPNCQCQSGSYYDSSKNTCDTCPGGQIRVGNSCECPQGTKWIGNSCVIDACPADQVLINGKCTDISGSCSDIVLCSGGESTYSSEKKKCVCPACSSTKTKCAISTRRVY